MLKTKEHHELIAQFDRDYSHFRTDKEPKELWEKGIVYQDGTTNQLFRAYQSGYSFAKAVQ